MNTPIYCEATHHKSPDGCYEAPDHEGQHRGWTEQSALGDQDQFYWDDAKEPAETFTDEELAILITALKPVAHFFPGLEAKLHRARAAVQ